MLTDDEREACLNSHPVYTDRERGWGVCEQCHEDAETLYAHDVELICERFAGR